MLTTTQTMTLFVRARIQKTGKVYTRSKDYARIVTEDDLKGHIKKRYYLLHGRKWIEVDEDTFRKETSQEREEEIRKQLTEELKERVQLEMKKVG